MITDQRKKEKANAIPLQPNSGGISTACKSLQAAASSSSGGAAELQQVDPGHADVCQTTEARRGWTWAGQLKFPSALSSREAKLILRLRPL